MFKLNLTKFTSQLHHKKKFYIKIGIFISLIILIILSVVIFFNNQNNKNNTDKQEEKSLFSSKTKEKRCKYQRLIDGVCVTRKSRLNPELVGVMIENHPDARPQSGLTDARIVYEAPVEGNYSRFLAIFLKDEYVEKVGPIRSSRPYYLNWLEEYGKPMYLHVGGSPEALEKIVNYGIFDLNEFYRGQYFWRSSDRKAPHNTYSSSKLWQKAWKKYYKKRAKNEETWLFNQKRPTECTNNCAQRINISFAKPDYVTTWQYDKNTKRYIRYQGNNKYVDDNDLAITADTVIIQQVETQIIDEVGRLKMTTIGRGKALIFHNGYVFEGYWQKDKLHSKTKWLDNNNQEIPLQSGKIWIEVINQTGSYSYE